MMSGYETQLLRVPWTNSENYASLSIRLTDSEMAFVENGVEVHREDNDLPFVSGYVYANAAGRGWFGGPLTNEAYYDNIRVRNYVEPEPTTEIGSEENIDPKESIQWLIDSINTWNLSKGTKNKSHLDIAEDYSIPG